jgi:tripeptide aminopeptidase
MVNAQRLARTFLELVEVDSVSRSEGTLAALLRQRFESMGAETMIDRAGPATGSDSGNLIVRLHGRDRVPPLLFAAHMDTVEPGRDIAAVFSQGRFSSAGNTILGADDKSAIAILLEVVAVLREMKRPHGPLELVFTVCEEVGLLGARHLEFDRLQARFGYALDATDPDGLVTHAPSANHFTVKIFGRAAHAGSSPEKGINAIVLAARAIAGLSIGRIDRETTCNVGRIEGGLATNIVAPWVTVSGEIRSHSDQKLEALTDRITAAFRSVVDDATDSFPEREPARVDVHVGRTYCRTAIPDDHPMVVLARRAAAGLGRTLRTKKSGGGSDANILFEHGIAVGVLGTGMRDVHTIGENIVLDDMVKAAELVLEIIRLHAKNGGDPVTEEL